VNVYELNQRECRLLKQQGYNDDQLRGMGFDAATIDKTVVCTGSNRGSKVKTKRCRECGAKCYYLDRDGICYGCTLTTKLSREGKSEPAPEAKDEWKQCMKSMDHPAIVKVKGAT
jgi:hypothetical protein